MATAKETAPKLLTESQAADVRDRIAPMATYLQRINERLRALGYDDSMPLLHDVVHASTRVKFLHMTLEAMTDPKRASMRGWKRRRQGSDT